MNKSSAFLSTLGHLLVVALIFAWGLKWPFSPEELKFEKVEVIDNAQFDALVQQSSKTISEAITPEEQPQPSLIPEGATPDKPKPVVDETIVDAEIISNNPIRDPKPKPVNPEPVVEEPVLPAVEEIPVEPETHLSPEAPPIGKGAPTRAGVPPVRPAELGVQAPVDTPKPDANIDDLLQGVLTEVVEPKPEPNPNPETQTATPDATPEQTNSTNRAPVPPARVETELNNANPVVVETGDSQTAGEVPAEEQPQAPETPTQPEVPVEPEAPATPEVPKPKPFVSKVGPTSAPPVRDGGSLNVTDARPVPPEPEPTPEPETPEPESPAEAVEDNIEALLGEVVQEVSEPAQPKPKPKPKPEPEPEETPSAPAEAATDAILADLGETAAAPTSSRDLSRIESNAIIAKIAKNWSVSTIADKPNLDTLIVKVKFTVDSTGILTTPVILLEPQDPNEDQKAAFRAADRAIQNSLPLDLPAEMDPSGVKWTLTFDPTAQTVGVN